MIRNWDIQFSSNWWLSLGFHVDHADPSITFHLPGIIIAIGRLKQPGFRKHIRYRKPMRNLEYEEYVYDIEDVDPKLIKKAKEQEIALRIGGFIK